MARKALLEAQLEAERTVARLSEDKSEYNGEHQAITEETEAVQNELRLSVDRHARRHDKQAAEMNAMGLRSIEMKDLLMQRELRMKSQLQEKCSQIQTMAAVIKKIQPQPENIVLTNSTQDASDPRPKPSIKNITLESRGKLTTPKDASTSKLLPPKHKQTVSSGIHTSAMMNTNPFPSATCKMVSAKDLITFETSSMGITDLRAPLCTNPTSQMTTTFQSANATLGELAEEFHTANDELPTGNPCASNTRQKKLSSTGTSNEYNKSTRGSSLISPAVPEDVPISP